MNSAPLILVSPSTEEKGVEFYDYSLSLSQAYLDAILLAGGLPLVPPCAPEAKSAAEYVRRCDGVMITGGDDIQPGLYTEDLSPKLRKTISRVDPKRDLLETLLIKEGFAQRKPILAICRGHQLLNVTLGGTLIPDIPQEVRTSINHSQLKHKDRPVHDVRLEPDSLLARSLGKQTISVNSSHHQAVAKIAPVLRVTGRASDDIVEVLELRAEEEGVLPYLLSVQFHPERLVYGCPEFIELFRGFVSACASNRVDRYEGKDSNRR